MEHDNDVKDCKKKYDATLEWHEMWYLLWIGCHVCLYLLKKMISNKNKKGLLHDIAKRKNKGYDMMLQKEKEQKYDGLQQ